MKKTSSRMFPGLRTNPASRIAFAGGAVLLFGLPHASAQDAWWDADPGTAQNQNGNGTWNTANTNWTSSPGGPNASWINGVNTAFLGNVSGTGYTNASTGGTITLGETIDLFALSMSGGQPGSYVINGAEGFTLNMTGSGETVPYVANNHGSATLTIHAVISGSDGLRKLNNGTVILAGENTYTGNTTINAGTLQIGTGGTSGGIAGNSITNNAALVFNRSDAHAYGGAISGSGSLGKQGAGVLTLTGANSYTGNTTIGGGALRIGHDTALGTTAGTTTITSGGGGRLELFNNITVNENIPIGARDSGLSLLNISGENTLTGTLTWNTGGNGYDVGSDSGKLTITGDVTPAGAGKTFRIHGEGDVEFSGIIGNTATSSAVAISKLGDGTLILSGENTYTGATTISAGTLFVTGSLGNTALAIGSGGTLAGTGTVGGNTIIEGTHAPGSSPGVQNFGADLTYSAGSTFEWDIQFSASETNPLVLGNHDQVNVAGNLAGENAIFRILLDGGDFSSDFWTVSRAWEVFTASGGFDLNDIFSGGFQYAGGSPDPLLHGTFSFNGSNLEWSAIPEPRTSLLIALALLPAVRRRRA